MPTKEQQILQTYFGYESFRPGQGETIDYILDQKNTLAVMPTGGGKSICYRFRGCRWRDQRSLFRGHFLDEGSRWMRFSRLVLRQLTLIVRLPRAKWLVG